MATPRYTGCVYLATNTVNGRRYIGKTKNDLSDRKAQHKCTALKGLNTPFCKAIRKYGWGSFQWAELFISDDEGALDAAEIALISDHRQLGANLYNLKSGGDGGSMPCTEERRQKLKIAMKGRETSETHRENLRRALTGKTKTPEQREQMRQIKLGTKLPGWTEERRAKYMAAWEAKRAAGFVRSTESREKMSAAAKLAAKDPKRLAMLKANAKAGAKARWG